MDTSKKFVRLIFMAVIFCLMVTATSEAAPGLAGKRVFVVNSYHSDSSAELKIKDGIDSVLKDVELKYFFMDTKKHPENGPAKAKEAFAIYKDFKPDAVITADDNAQSLFVLPYLKDKVDTPIVFCGVNDDASQYGFPNNHITGILEKKHYKAGIYFAKLIVPEINKVAVIYKENPSNKTNLIQIKREMPEYPAKIAAFLPITNTTELLKILQELEEKIDALIVLNLAGITDENGKTINTKAGMTLVSERWPKLTIGASQREIEAGLFCGVAKLNTEQGQVAANMVKDILGGKAVKDIPVTENRNGQRTINVSTARKLGVDLKPIVLIGTKLVQ